MYSGHKQHAMPIKTFTLNRNQHNIKKKLFPQ